MGISRLRALLEKVALEEDIQFTIPHPFLPPRFRKVCKNRNMLLLLDRDMTIHVRWEGERMSEHRPLTKGATRRLVREVLRKMKGYRIELGIYARFIERWAEEPFNDDRYESIQRAPDPPKAEKEVPKDPVSTGTEISANIELELSEMPQNVGGSSPLPDWNW